MTLPQPQPQVNVMAGFVVDEANPAIGRLHFEVGPASFDLGLTSANVVGFLRALADDTETKLAQQPKLSRPVPGLFLPNGNVPSLPNLPRG